MNVSRRLSSSLVFLSAVVTGLTAFSSLAGAQTPSDALFRNLILQRLQAHSRGDVGAYRRLLDKDFVHVDDAGKRRIAAEMGAIAQADNSHWILGKSHTRVIAPTLAIVDCEVTELAQFGPRTFRMPLHETDVFVLRDGKWLFLEHAETHALDSPPAVKPDDASLRDFPGVYEWWPGYDETISRHGNQLYGQGPGDKTVTPMLAASSESFFVQGDPAIAVFVRGPSGKVTHELIHFPDGKVVIARKVR
jgi:hypothetical protein